MHSMFWRSLQRNNVAIISRYPRRTSVPSCCKRPLGSRSRGGRGNRTARRTELAIDKRLRRTASKNNTKETVEDGEQIFSESGMKWGFFFSLGVLPLFAFGVTVSATPHLRQQFNEMIGGISINRNAIQSDSTNANDKEEAKV